MGWVQQKLKTMQINLFKYWDGISFTRFEKSNCLVKIHAIKYVHMAAL